MAGSDQTTVGFLIVASDRFDVGQHAIVGLGQPLSKHKLRLYSGIESLHRMQAVIQTMLKTVLQWCPVSIRYYIFGCGISV